MNKSIFLGIFCGGILLSTTAFAFTAADCASWNACIKTNCCAKEKDPSGCVHRTLKATQDCNAQLYAENLNKNFSAEKLPKNMTAPQTQQQPQQQPMAQQPPTSQPSSSQNANKSSTKKSSINWF